MSVSVSPSILTFSPSPGILLPLSVRFFLLVSFSLSLLGLCPSFVVVEGGSCGRGHTRTYILTHKKMVEEIESRNRQGPSCVWVPLEGLCHLHWQYNFSALVFHFRCVCCASVSVCVWMYPWICVLYVSDCGLVIFSPAQLELELILKQILSLHLILFLL